MQSENIGEEKFVRNGTAVGKGEEGYIVSLDEEHAYSLNPAAFYVWLLCDGELTVNEIIDKIAKSTGLERSELEEPVKLIINELVKVSLLKKA